MGLGSTIALLVSFGVVTACGRGDGPQAETVPGQVRVSAEEAGVLEQEAVVPEPWSMERVRSELPGLVTHLPHEERVDKLLAVLPYLTEPDYQAFAEYGMIEALLYLGRYAEAEARVERALEIPTSSYFHSFLVAQYGELQCAMGTPLLARDALLEALDQPDLDIEAKSKLEIRLVDAYLNMGSYTLARSRIERALKDNRGVPTNVALRLSRLQMGARGRSLAEQQEFQEDLTYILEHSVNTTERWDARIRGIRWHYRSGRAGEALALLDEFEGEPETLLDRIEIATLRSLCTRGLGLPLEEVASELDAVFRQQLAEWHQSLPGRSTGFGFFQTAEYRDMAVEWIALQEAMGSRREVLVKRILELQSRSTLARRLGVEQTPDGLVDVKGRPIGVGDVDALVPSGGALLVLVPGWPHSYALAIDAEGIHLEELPPYTTLIGAMRSYSLVMGKQLDALQGTDREETIEKERELAANLGEMLLAPFREALQDWQALTIVGRDLIIDVAFSNLLVDGERLGARFPLYELPSFPIGIALGRREARRAPLRRGLTVVAGIPTQPPQLTLGEDLPPLPFDAEARAQLLGGVAVGPWLSLIGRQARWSEIVESDLGTSGVLTLLCHGVEDPDHEQPIALVLHSEDANDPEAALLRYDEVAALDGAPPLVLAVACLSGVGAQRRGDPGSTDMPGAWLSAGAGAVLAGYDRLRYRAVVELQGELLRGLSSPDVTAAEALWQVRRTLYQRDDADTAFGVGDVALIGLGELMPLGEMAGAASTSGWRRRLGMFSLLAGGILLGSALLLYRRK